MRRRAAEIQAAEPGRAAARSARADDEIGRLGDDAERDARAPRGGVRARAHLRRRREPRAADAARDPQGRARAGAARGPQRRGARGRAAVGRRGDRPARAARRGPARDRALGPGAAADPARARSTARERARRGRARFAGVAPTCAADGLEPRAPTGCGCEQALGNLVDNALRHGGSTVELAAERATATASSCTCATTAPAFPHGFVDEAFERFTRADAARGRGGAGLGPGDRRRDRPGARRRGRRAQPPRRRGRRLDLGAVRVLIVEDEVKMAALIRRGLREDGMAADVAVKRRGRAVDGRRDRVRRDRARRDAARASTASRSASGCGRTACARAGADADRARRGRGPRPRARHRRRRLPHQAVLLRRAVGAAACARRAAARSSARRC